MNQETIHDPGSQAKQDALNAYARYVNPQKVRVLKAAGLDIIESRREGAWVWDVDGRKFLDCFTSAGSFNIGRRNPKVVKAMHDAVDRLDHGNFLLCSKEKANLASKLAEISPGDLCCVMFGTGGGEAVDFALKLARGATGRSKILSTVNGYHGHTGFALSAAGRDAYRLPFEPLMPLFERVEFGDINAVSSAIDESTAAVLVEPIQGEGGVRVPPDGYLRELRRLCNEKGALLILDEIQTGFGRSGKWFASEHEGVVPDIMTVAKSLGGSLVAISATIFTEELREFLIPNPFIHLSTFGGSDLSCAVALAVIEVMQESGLVEHAGEMGAILHRGLRQLAVQYPEVILEVRGKGLMAGIKLCDDSMGPRLSYNLSRHGVLAIYSGNEPSVMRLMPALVIEEGEINFLLNACQMAIDDIKSGKGPKDETPRRGIRRPRR
ncbi:MAG: aspartate aminotransferase family protein [Actinobacteria bacterium]|nr:aspartate aminotransferase family protein [Actinomycetota bacterium]